MLAEVFSRNNCITVSAILRIELTFSPAVLPQLASGEKLITKFTADGERLTSSGKMLSMVLPHQVLFAVLTLD